MLLLLEWLCTLVEGSVTKTEEIILNAHCVAVSVVNNDASPWYTMCVAVHCQLRNRVVGNMIICVCTGWVWIHCTCCGVMCVTSFGTLKIIPNLTIKIITINNIFK